MDKLTESGQADALTPQILEEAIYLEMTDYFHGTSVEGLVALQGRSVARYAVARAMQMSDEARSEICRSG